MFVCSEFTNYLLNYLLGISSSSSWYTGLFLFLFLFFIRSLISTCWRFIIFACALIQSFRWAQTVTTLFWSPYFPAISSRRCWIPTRSPVPGLLRFLGAESPSEDVNPEGLPILCNTHTTATGRAHTCSCSWKDVCRLGHRVPHHIESSDHNML